LGAAVGCGVLLASSVVVIGGWGGGVDALKSIVPGFSSMKVNTAIAIGALGAALALTGADKRYRPIGNASASVALIIGVLTLAEYAFHWNAGIDQLWFKDTVTSPTAAPGRPAVATAVMASLLGVALLCAGRPALAREKTIAAVISSMIAWATLTGYVFGPQALHEVGLFSSVALHTAVLTLLLGLGVLVADPVSWPIRTALTPSTGGVICRWLLPPAILAPPILGWLLSRDGVLDFFPAQFDWALYSAISTFGSVWLILTLAHRITTIDAERSSATQLSRALLQHSDQGSQYANELYQLLLADHGIQCSMSRTGNVWDNSAMESFFSSLKIERVHRRGYRTRDEARSDIFNYIECFYNPHRRHSTLDYVSPAAYERLQTAQKH
jgi:hypothetical protein